MSTMKIYSVYTQFISNPWKPYNFHHDKVD